MNQDRKTEMEPTVQRGYLLCATPRSGSTWLCEMLASTGVAGKPESYFRSEDRRNWEENLAVSAMAPSQAFFNAVLDRASTENGRFGIRVMWGTLEEIVAEARSIRSDWESRDTAILEREFGTLDFLYLRRDAAVDQAVSWYLAETRDLWHLRNDSLNLAAEATFDFDAIDALVGTIRAHNRAWRDWFDREGIRPVEVVYEEAMERPADTVRWLLAEMGLKQAGLNIASSTQRLSNDVNRRLARQYREEIARLGRRVDDPQ